MHYCRWRTIIWWLTGLMGVIVVIPLHGLKITTWGVKRRWLGRARKNDWSILKLGNAIAVGKIRARPNVGKYEDWMGKVHGIWWGSRFTVDFNHQVRVSDGEIVMHLGSDVNLKQVWCRPGRGRSTLERRNAGRGRAHSQSDERFSIWRGYDRSRSKEKLREGFPKKTEKLCPFDEPNCGCQ